MVILPQNTKRPSVRIMLAQDDLVVCFDVLEPVFMAADPDFFALPEWSPDVPQTEKSPKTSIPAEQQVFAND